MQMWTNVNGIVTARLLRYDTGRYPFAALAGAVFKSRALHQLHVDWLRHKIRRGLPPVLGYADNLSLRKMLQDLDDASPFYAVYNRFVVEVIGAAFGRKISYSAHPKMRVHLAGTPTVSKWHRDADITLRPEQINVWLPFTNAYDSNSLWIETGYGRADYRPVTVAYGQALIFDGGFLSHGTVDNATGDTRVSIDFRFAVQREKLPRAAQAIFACRPDDLTLRSDSAYPEPAS
jgi:hypothetical protein